jgi:hypothetical protein
MLVIWASTGAGYFWPLWPLAGWGIGVLSHALAYRSSPRNKPNDHTARRSTEPDRPPRAGQDSNPEHVDLLTLVKRQPPPDIRAKRFGVDAFSQTDQISCALAASRCWWS